MAALLLWKVRFGFPYEETVYISTAQRFVDGDIPVLHEWHGTQFSYFYLMPLLYLYSSLFETTVGIVLFFRYCFALVWIVLSLWAFIRLRKITYKGAAICSLILILFVPYEEMSLCYNTICIATLFSSLLIAFTAGKHKNIQYVISGILYSVSVTCCPFLAVIFLVLPVVFFYSLHKKDRGRTAFCACIFAGIIISFALFAAFLLSRASLTDYIRNIHHVFSDSEHRIDFIDKVVSYVTSLWEPVPVLLFWIMTVVLAVYMKRKDAGSRYTGLAGVILLSVVLLILFTVLGYRTFYLLAPCGIGIYLRICFDNEVSNRVFLFLWIPGVIYSVCIAFASNLGLTSMTLAFSFSSIASIIMLIRIIEDDVDMSNTLAAHTRRVTAASVILIIFMISVLTENRIFSVFCEDATVSLDSYVDHGIAKGLTVSGDSYNAYNFYYEDTKELRENDSVDRVVVITHEQWIYLELSKKIGAQTAWTHIYTPEILSEYYSLYPDKFPDAVYIDSIYESYAPFFESLGFIPHRTPYGGIIMYPS